MYNTMDPTYPMGEGIDEQTQAFAFSRPGIVGMGINQFRPFTAPFSHKVGLIRSYMKGVASNIFQYYLYQPSIWKNLVRTGELKWPGILGLRGFMGGEREAIMGGFGTYMKGGKVYGLSGKIGAYMGRPVRKGVSYVLTRLMREEYAGAARSFTTEGLRGFATRMYAMTWSPAWKKISEKAAKFGTRSIKMGTAAPLVGKIGTGVSYAALAYEAVKGVAWLGGTVVRTGASMLDKAAKGMRDMHRIRYKLPDGYRTPEAATMRSRALSEMQASRSNLRNIMLGNEAYYLHR